MDLSIRQRNAAASPDRLKMIIRTILVIWFTAIAFFVWLGFSFAVGDTWGLEQKLANIDGVVKIEEYKVYEGKASFRLVLDNGTLYLSNVGNKEIRGPGSIIILGVENKIIKCRIEGTTIGTRGVSVNYLMHDYFPNLNLSTVQQVVNEYEQIIDLFSSHEVLITNPTTLSLQEKETRVCILE